MKVFTYVVSLADQIDRRGHIAKQLAALNLPFLFHDACDFRNLDVTEIDNYIEVDKLYGRPQRRLTRGEVGCALSHITLLNKIKTADSYSSDCNILVLEDDAKLEPELIGFLNSDELNKFDWDVIILGYSKLKNKDRKSFFIKEPIKKTHTINGLSIGRVWKEWTCGTVGYLVNGKSINKFSLLKVSTVADDWDFLQKKLDLNILHCRPLLIEENFLEFSSAIESERKTYVEHGSKFFDFIRCCRGICRRLVMNFKHR